LRGGKVPLCYYVLEEAGEPRFGLISGDHIVDLREAAGLTSLSAALEQPVARLFSLLRDVSASQSSTVPLAQASLRAPIDRQEVWAAGVTYLRSRDARMEESTQKDIYDRVYDADRPELFLKATPNRVSGPGDPIAIRPDSNWDVPEPELAILFNAGAELVGYTVGNDVSSRSIEGENPLYLPQAKVFFRCAGLGPVIMTGDELSDPSDLEIRLTIRRDGELFFQETTSTARMHRSLQDLREYLWRANEFPAGVFLMTGTGIVPPSEFTLQHGDEVTVDIAGIGALVNPVIRLDS
jgi:2-dehydro-3-deoxy-D-arabinonate dehydratase